MSRKKTTTDYRSAVTGRFVNELYAKRNPNTTVKERNPLPSRSKR